MVQLEVLATEEAQQLIQVDSKVCNVADISIFVEDVAWELLGNGFCKSQVGVINSFRGKSGHARAAVDLILFDHECKDGLT